MFDNVGQKLQKQAENFFIISSVLGVLGAVVCLIIGLTEDDFSMVLGYLVASLILLAGNLLVARLIFGFGILVEKAEKDLNEKEPAYSVKSYISTKPTRHNKDECKTGEKGIIETTRCPRCGNAVVVAAGSQSGHCIDCGIIFSVE